VRVLVVEDSPTARRVIARVAETRGHVVQAVGDAEEALDAHSREPFQLMIIDWQLPGMDGVELCRRVCAQPGGEAVGILIVTGRDRPEDIALALDAGATDYLVKPLEGDLIDLRLTILERRARLEGQRRAAEEELAARNNELEELLAERIRAERALLLADRMASMGRLAGGVAHEINNPLSYVIANLTFVSDELPRLAIPADRRTDLDETLEEAREGLDRVREIVRDLRAFSRPVDDRHGLVDPRAVLESAIGLCRNEIRHRARIVMELTDAPHVYASEARLGQLFLNLLLNAAYAIPEREAEGHEIRVKLCADATGGVEIEITDTGVGIAPEHLPHVFDPFFTTKPLGEGRGLGLAVCHGIVHALGGEIGIDSTPGRGTTVRLSLPSAPADSRLPPRVTSGPTSKPPSSRASVLVVDDDPLVAKALKRALRGHDVTVATGGREAIERIASGQRFDLVLCDIMMPDVTGMDVYDAARREGRSLEDAFVFITGGAFTTRAREFLTDVPNRVLEKPFDVQAIRDLVRELGLTSSVTELAPPERRSNRAKSRKPR